MKPLLNLSNPFGISQRELKVISSDRLFPSFLALESHKEN